MKDGKEVLILDKERIVVAILNDHNENAKHRETFVFNDCNL